MPLSAASERCTNSLSKGLRTFIPVEDVCRTWRTCWPLTSEMLNTRTVISVNFGSLGIRDGCMTFKAYKFCQAFVRLLVMNRHEASFWPIAKWSCADSRSIRWIFLHWTERQCEWWSPIRSRNSGYVVECCPVTWMWSTVRLELPNTNACISISQGKATIWPYLRPVFELHKIFVVLFSSAMAPFWNDTFENRAEIENFTKLTAKHKL